MPSGKPMDPTGAPQDTQDHAETHHEPPEEPPGCHPETPRHRLRTVSDEQGTLKGAEGSAHNVLNMLLIRSNNIKERERGSRGKCPNGNAEPPAPTARARAIVSTVKRTAAQSLAGEHAP